MTHRTSAVSGQFYPASCEEVEAYIRRFNDVLEENPFKSSSLVLTPRAIIVPHAGYVYSGFTANIAFKTAQELSGEIDRIVVIGPSHRTYLKGASVALFDDYDSPCDPLIIDVDFSKALKAQFEFISYLPTAHNEHSTEVQMPFVKHYFDKAKVVEIVYGDVAVEELSQLIDELFKQKRTLVVISTDLSHFHSLQRAKVLDELCMQGVADLDRTALEKGCEACGLLGVKALTLSARRHGFKSKLLNYSTSADVTKDQSSVVGYLSAVIGEV